MGWRGITVFRLRAQEWGGVGGGGKGAGEMEQHHCSHRGRPVGGCSTGGDASLEDTSVTSGSSSGGWGWKTASQLLEGRAWSHVLYFWIQELLNERAGWNKDVV